MHEGLKYYYSNFNVQKVNYVWFLVIENMIFDISLELIIIKYSLS